MRRSLASTVAAFVLAPLSAWAEPNILLIIADDMGLDASACYDVGDQQARMPNLERMCAEGLVFDRAYSAPVCSPTRATIMTGRYGFRTGVGGAIPKREGGAGLSPDEVSLFDRLDGSGYASAVIGKWHVASDPSNLDHPSELGVPSYFGLFSGGVRDYWNWNGVENGKAVKVDGYATTVLTDRAIDWIGEQDDPWFLWLAYNAPHTPFHLPPADLHGADGLSDDPAAIRKTPLPYYNAMLEALDTEIGRLLASMDAATRDDTVVMFIGDNGTPGFVAERLYGKRRTKGSLYEGGTHVPMVAIGPGVRNGRTDAFVNTTDLHVTIAGLAGVEAKTADSIDFGPVLKGEPGARDYIYVEHFSTNVKPPDVLGHAIRVGRFKLVAPDGEAEQLYDVVADPLEQTDLLAGSVSSEATAKAGELRQRIAEIRARGE